MVQEPSPAQPKAPWRKIFTAFKIALDLRKLVLAAAGIFLVAMGWSAIGWTFYGMRTFPEWKNFEDKDNKDQREAQWTQFKTKRASWNLIHELAGSPSERKPVDAADVTNKLEEYLLLSAWEEAFRHLSDPIIVKGNTLEVPRLESSQKTFKLTPIGDATLSDRSLTLQHLVIDPKLEKNVVLIDGVMAAVEEGKFEDLKKYREGALNPLQIDQKARGEKDQKVAQQALLIFNTQLVKPKIKPAGRLRISPWSEERGANQYLIVADTLKSPGDAVGASGNVLNWLFSDKCLVLLEPLVKFLSPFVYLFDARAGAWDRLYLIFIILWTLAIWGFFGGAISRMAAVQVARNERLGMRETLGFTRERFVSYVAAPVFPMVLLAVFVVVLMLFGWLAWTPWFGELFAGLFWPVVILIGLIMAIVMVGLIGWPLMIATISTEGSDSFDALSRSYSYIYQAPWHYVWYNFLAILYGALLVFFVGFMASLMVFVGKWGVSCAIGLSSSNVANDREPSYLFYYAPTSYGWRDLLISGNQFTEIKHETTPDGRPIERREFTQEYEDNMHSNNKFGAFLVSIWIYPLFLLVLGFSYSYFWSSSTIIYFLMRSYVDDTEMDEVHLDGDDLDDPFMNSTAPPPAAPAPPPSKPGTLSLNVVEAPPASPPPPPSEAPPPPPPPASSPPSPPSDGHT
jgi:hypothetical protein